ncbi:hypothetical protein ACVQ92_04640 [Staphylococcus aureus]
MSPEQIKPRIATGDELMLIHKYDYVEKLLSMLHMALSVKMRLRNMD